jgi:CTP:molybdopterin cytidylyltransferase MocA
MPVYAILLAAGQGARFGGKKLLAPLAGRPLVDHAAGALAESMARGVLAGGVAVVPVGATALAFALDAAGLSLVENPDPRGGLSGSLRLGISAVGQWASEPGPAAALVVLADQPYLRSEVIARLVEAWRASGRSVRPRYQESPEAPGHPVLLDRALWPLVEQLSGDTGLRELLNEQAIDTVDVEGGNPDVDTARDLADLEDGER